MNTTSLTRHLLLKDLRHQRVWLALVWAFALLLPFVTRLVNGSTDGFTQLGVSGFFLLIFFVLTRLIRLDAPGRQFHFLATRPVPWTVLLAGKVVFIAAFLLVPVWIAKFATLYLLGVPINTLDVVLILAENALCVGALLAAVVLFSLFFRNPAMVFLSMFVVGFAFLFSYSFFTRMQADSVRGVSTRPENLTLNNCKFLVFYLGCIATVSAVAVSRYRLKSPLKPLAVLVAGLVITVAATRFWPYDFSQPFADRPRNNGEVQSPLRDRIKLTFDEGKNVMQKSGGTSNGIRNTYYTHAVSLEGVDLPYFATLVEYEATATLKSGRVIHSTYQFGNFGPWNRDFSEGLRQQMAGFTPSAREPRNWNSFQILNYRPDDYANEDLTGATIRGELTLEIRKAVIIKTTPFKAGAKLGLPRLGATIRDVVFNPDSVSYKFVINSVTSTLRGDAGGFRSADFTWLIFNRGKGECLGSSSGRGSSSAGTFCNVEIRDNTAQREAVNGDFRKQKEPIPADWADNAEISFFTTESLGRMSFPYELKNVDLEH